MKRIMQASEILHEMFIGDDPEANARIDAERQRLKLIDALRHMRERAGLTQAQLAKKVGTTRSQIAQLEDPNCEEQSLQDLQDAVAALGMSLEWKIVKPSRKRRKARVAGAA